MPDTPTRGAGATWSDDRIIGALAGLRDQLRVPVEPLAVPRPDRGSGRRSLLVAAAVLVVVALGAVIAPAREAVADWLGIGATEVQIDPGASVPTSSLPVLADGARAVDEAAAHAALGRSLPPIRHPASAGPPEYAIPLEGGVLVRWPGREETLWLRRETSDTHLYFKKFAPPDAEIAHVDGLGDDALWLGSSHVLQTPGREVAASHVLLWIDDGLEFRLEGGLGRDEMVAIARALGS